MAVQMPEPPVPTIEGSKVPMPLDIVVMPEAPATPSRKRSAAIRSAAPPRGSIHRNAGRSTINSDRVVNESKNFEHFLHDGRR